MATRRGPRLARLIAFERGIARTEGAGIVGRIRSGAYLLADPALCTSSGHLRHGAADIIGRALVAAGQQEVPGYELRDRLQAARTYRTADQIAWATTRFQTWTALREARFPPAEGADGAQLALVDDGGDVVTEDGTPVQTEIALTLADLGRVVRLPALLTLRQVAAQTGEWADRHARYGEAIDRRRHALDLLLAAVDGDEDVLVRDAADRLRELGPPPRKPPLPPGT